MTILKRKNKVVKQPFHWLLRCEDPGLSCCTQKMRQDDQRQPFFFSFFFAWFAVVVFFYASDLRRVREKKTDKEWEGGAGTRRKSLLRKRTNRTEMILKLALWEKKIICFSITIILHSHSLFICQKLADPVERKGRGWIECPCPSLCSGIPAVFVCLSIDAVIQISFCIFLIVASRWLTAVSNTQLRALI